MGSRGPRQGTCKTARPVVRSDGEVYPSACEAARQLGMSNSSHIASACCGRQKSAGGYGWRFLECWEAEALGMAAAKPGELKSVYDYADSKVYRDVMRRLWQGTCRQCKFYAKVGGREVCGRSARVMDTDSAATCPRWENAPTEADVLRAQIEEGEERRRAAQIAAAKAELERRAKEREEQRAAQWEFRSQVLGLNVEYFVRAICARYGITDHRTDR